MARETLSIKGSDTLVQLVSNLVEAFAKENPGVRISVTGGGSGTGIAALLNGQIPIANSSRSIKEEELAQAKEGGLYIQEFIVAREGLSVIVSPHNPVSEVTMEQLGKIYRAEITNWKEIGGKDQAIVLYGRQTGSGTYVFFKEKVVKGDYALVMKNMEGNQAIVDAIKADRQGIGYVGIGYVVDEPGKVREGIKVLKISLTPESAAISPLDAEKVAKGEYPLARPLFQYLSGVPQKGSLIEKFLLFQSSLVGHEIIKGTGFLPPIPEELQKNQALFERIK